MREVNGTRQQHRRDFKADYECEGCGHIEKDVNGYDDHNFHVNVIPGFKCKECGESTNSLGVEIEDKTRAPKDLIL